MTTENINWLAVIGVAFQCLTGLTLLGAALSAWRGINLNKVASAKKTDTDEKPEQPGNPWLVGATVLVVVSLVFGCLGLGLSLPSTMKESNPNVTETAPTPMPDSLTPMPNTQDFTSYCNPPLPTGKTFTAPEGGVRLPNGAEVTMGKAYVYRVVNWSLDCKSAEVYIFFTLSSTDYRTAGPNFDNSKNHDQQVWAFEGDKLENILPKVTCDLARDTLSGGLGKDTSVNVHFSNQVNGQYTDVPEQCRP